MLVSFSSCKCSFCKCLANALQARTTGPAESNEIVRKRFADASVLANALLPVSALGVTAPAAVLLKKMRQTGRSRGSPAQKRGDLADPVGRHDD
jgi:hypothetical protein